MAEFKLIPPHLYQGNQIVFSSDRIVLNSKSDAILMFAPQAIGFSSAGTLNFDSDKECIINSPKIYLGLKTDGTKPTEPLLLGNKTTDYITVLLQAIQLLSNQLKKQGKHIGLNEYSDIALAPSAQNLEQTVNELLSKIDTIKSTNNFTT